MRCKYGATPMCKVNRWREELILLRSLVLSCGLFEELKWSIPCYTHEGKNVLTISAFKEYACLSFFKGALIEDKNSLFAPHGESAQAARLIKFTKCSEITNQEPLLRNYISEAVAIEKSGKKVEFKKNPEPMPDELVQALEFDASFKQAFYRLTPGRQRGYIIYFSQPKQTQTRIGRIEKCKSRIFEGLGWNES